MNLYTIIRDFFVMYVFGGTTSNDYLYNGMFGYSSYGEGNMNYPTYTDEVYVHFEGITFFDGSNHIPLNVTFSDWLSTTATIITLVALFVGIALLTIKLFKIVSNIIALR